MPVFGLDVLSSLKIFGSTVKQACPMINSSNALSNQQESRMGFARLSRPTYAGANVGSGQSRSVLQLRLSRRSLARSHFFGPTAVAVASDPAIKAPPIEA